jgi:hypothetical protein
MDRLRRKIYYHVMEKVDLKVYERINIHIDGQIRKRMPTLYVKDLICNQVVESIKHG